MKEQKKEKITCSYCNKTSEWVRKINYCPFCGKSLSSKKS